jgi:hypothetical protein
LSVFLPGSTQHGRPAGGARTRDKSSPNDVHVALVVITDGLIFRHKTKAVDDALRHQNTVERVTQRTGQHVKMLHVIRTYRADSRLLLAIPESEISILHRSKYQLVWDIPVVGVANTDTENAFPGLHRQQAGNGLAVARHDYFLASFGHFEKLREIRFSLMYIELSHID